MTSEFLSWYETNERRFDGTAKQAAWLAWEARSDARTVAQARLEVAHEDGFGVRAVAGSPFPPFEGSDLAKRWSDLVPVYAWDEQEVARG